ncbi:hypothetical protein G4B88_029598 [Cannabis sativa]|uniref:RNase H type-1 domain-containing protein n=1 Tax=Cannabis sativa TaxID=3483 RepID=A0A7J6FZG6_CANSA|nr:hypothetical protein G4B88_029598 [Cannabis sativa]
MSGLENFTVSSLFQVNNRSWDVEVVRDLSSPKDAAIILGIPLNSSGGADSWYWVAEKNEWHILVSCNFTWSCWEYAGLAAASRDSSSLRSWLVDTFRLVNGESLGRVVMLCWAIWSARNDLLWKQRVRSVKDVVTFSDSSVDQWLKAQGKDIPLLSPLKDGDGSELWVKSFSGIKLNVDAAIFDHSSKHGFGCVVRNSNGELVAAFAGVKHGKVSPDLAEIMGIREALSWLKNHAYKQAIVETDNLVYAEAICSAERSV